MDLLRDFLARRGIQMPPESVARTLVLSYIQEHIGITLNRKQVHLVGRTLRFDVEPPMRAVIRTHTTEIQAALAASDIFIDTIF